VFFGRSGGGKPISTEGDSSVRISASARLPTKHGVFKIRIVVGSDRKEHVILYKGRLGGRANVPFRIHSECLTSEVFNSMRCDCNEQLEAALAYIQNAGVGLLIYLRQEGRGIGLFNKIRAYALQDEGLDTVEANEQLGFPPDQRTYGLAAQILERLRIRSVRILTNNPEKINAMRAHGIVIADCLPLTVRPNRHNKAYLKTKRAKLNHKM
jgi:3,4-dihydroxy 2-butanone 4-phosphate synthase/GTP cyclohydrolase II